MSKFSSPASACARRVARTIVPVLFSLAMFVAGLTPLAAPVEAQSRAKVKVNRRARVVVAKTQARAGKRRAETAGRDEEERFDQSSPGEEGEDNVDKREAWFRLQRSFPFDTPPPDARRLAWESRPKGRLKDGAGRAVLSAAISQWTPIGPAPVTPKFPSNWGLTSGRINAIAVNPQDANVVLVGASTGGIWRSIDGGTTFAPASDTQVDLSVGAIAFAPSNPSIVYAGMGDLGNSYLGTGVLKSTDGGATWSRVSQVLGTDCQTLPAFNVAGCLPAPGIATTVVVDPNDPNRVYLSQYLYYNGNSSNLNTASGIYVSTDGGVTWKRTLSGLPRDLVIKPNDPQTLYAGMRRVDTNVDGVNTPGVYKSTNGGQTWARVYDSPYTPATNLRDIRVAVTPVAPESVYVFVGQTVSPANVRVNVSTDGGAHWDAATTATGVDPGQFGYNTYLYVDPTDANNIYVATRDVYKSANGGATWSSVTKNFVGASFNYNPFGSASHPDQHSFAFSPGNPSTFYIGNDGGISKTTDGGAHFASLNASLTLSQFVGIASHPTNPNFQVGGTQDNGTQIRTASGNGIGWTEFAEGDGGFPVISSFDPSEVFSTYVNGRIRWWKVNASGTPVESFSRNTDNSTFGESLTSPRINFYAPFTDNGVDGTVYFGTWKLFISTSFANPNIPISPSTWVAPGGTFDQTTGNGDVLSAIGVQHSAYSNSQVIYTGAAGGRVMVSHDGGATWTNATSNLPVRYVESVTVDPANPAIAYVTLGGYGSGHVFKTTNFGQSWADLSGANPATKLPNIPTTALLIDPANTGLIYVGTDVGVFRSTGDGNWETFNNGLPPVPVTSFSVSANGKIQIGTYGRGAYELATTADVATVQFFPSALIVSEADGDAQITVTRSGDPASTVSVDVRTVDDPAAVACNVSNGIAYARCDYETTAQTLTFAPNEFTKTVNVPLVNDAHVESSETLQLALSNPVNATINGTGMMTLTITSDDLPGKPNPIDGTDFFVRMQYLDFLSREPEPGQPWSAVLNTCPSGDTRCDRVSVSTGFFRSPEFEFKGRFVFDFYKVSFGRLPLYAEIIPDINSVTGSTTAEVIAKKAAFTNKWVQRTEFRNLFDALTNTQFVGTLMDRYSIPSVRTPNPVTPDDASDVNKVTLTRADLINRLGGVGGTLTRAQVVRAIADSDEVSSREFNSAFVAMQYYGYLRRDPEPQGYADWLRTINANPSDIRSMVSGFINSPEYRLRFGTP